MFRFSFFFFNFLLLGFFKDRFDVLLFFLCNIMQLSILDRE